MTDDHTAPQPTTARGTAGPTSPAVPTTLQNPHPKLPGGLAGLEPTAAWTRVAALFTAAWGATLAVSVSLSLFGTEDITLLRFDTALLPEPVDAAIQATAEAAAVVAVAWLALGQGGFGHDRRTPSRWEAWPVILITGMTTMWAASMLMNGLATLAAGRQPAPPDATPPPVSEVLSLLPFAVRAAIVEEVVVAAAVLLLERGRAPVWSIYAAVLAARITYHAYYGPMAVLPVILWATAYLWLYRRYRSLTPLITAHMAVNTIPLAAYLAFHSAVDQ